MKRDNDAKLGTITTLHMHEEHIASVKSISTETSDAHIEEVKRYATALVKQIEFVEDYKKVKISNEENALFRYLQQTALNDI
jgi:hypothetical protein